MLNKTTTLSSILIASIFVTACAGNNIKQQEMETESQKSAKKTEMTEVSNITDNSEIILSDFPVEIAKTDSDIKPIVTETSNSREPNIRLINFKFNKFEISDSSKLLVKEHAEFLVSNPNYVLTVNGHSDYRGPEIYNEKLSLRRANTIASLLISYGASESQIVVNSFGASQPVEDFDNWHQNRRVEFEYSELYMVSK